MIYLDNAATTFPKPECVYDRIDYYNRNEAVNAGRGAYKLARKATAMLKDVKTDLISLIDARGQADVVFAPSVTVALNQIIGGYPWEAGMNVYLSPYEHNAVIRPLHLMAKRAGINIIELPIKEDLSIDLDKTEEMFKDKNPAAVFVTAVSNATGYVLPAREIFLLAKEYDAFTVLDGAQAVGILPIRFGYQMADCITFAGHKTLYATFGIAGFYIRDGIELNEFIVGGNGIKSEDPEMPRYMPEKLEAASMDSPAIAGLQASLKWLKENPNVWRHEQEITRYLLEQLRECDETIIYAAPDMEHQAGIVSINRVGFRANEVAAILDVEYDIAVRAGHHCAGLIHKHLDNKEHDGTMRISVGAFTTKEDIDTLIKGLKSIDREMLKGIDADILRGNC